MQDQTKDRSTGGSGSPDQGDLPQRNRTNVSEAPEMDRERGTGPDMNKPSKAEGERDDAMQKGGSQSNRAGHSGATGERSTSGGRNKPEPKDQDEKGMARPRNR
jgi:hypothetical protein